MTTGKLKLGKLPPSNKPALRFGTLLAATPAAAQVPPVIDYLSEVTDWPMDGNDQYGDCVWAETDHAYRAATRYASGTEKGFTLAQILKGYSDVTGFNQNDPNTDQGTVIQDALDYWRKTGIGGDKIVAFAKVDHTNRAEVNAALYYFGHLSYGFSFPSTAMDQFNAGKPWTVVKGASIEGGHCVDLGYSDGKIYRVVTWAKAQEVDPAFFDKYADEAWVIVTQDWVDAQGKSPGGLDLPAWGEEFAALTGQPNPFPSPGPNPTPEPPQPPAPVPPEPPQPAPPVGPDDADQALYPILLRLSHHPWQRLHRDDHAAIQAWFQDKGYPIA